MSIILSQIEDRKARIMAEGFNPIIIVITKAKLAEVAEYFNSFNLSNINVVALETATLLGLRVVIDDRVKDFQVIDDRSWVYQK